MASGTLPEQRKLDISGYEALVFDLDGTLYPSVLEIEFRIPNAMLSATKEHLGIDTAEAKELIRKYKEEYKSSIIGFSAHHGIDPITFLSDAFSKLNIDSIESYPSLPGALQRLSESHRILVLTNSFSEYAYKVLNHIGLSNVDKSQVFSTDKLDFFRKPTHECIDRFINRSGVNPAKTALFDDSYLNIDLAKSKGFTTVQVSNRLAREPYFWEMHVRRFHTARPTADFATHSIEDFLNAI